ncbi:peroxide stress protein YaaA [Dietzia sp. PP-33]|uniref:YaaA family protein n=1 Tax=Dietzia sp. PP-33 TaxID=2957500 RepID=UPI0029AE0B4C|nr:peroxide stress protein YaaA [Dietzia sp. PP-33]MDX2355606.1 peroxide stress protein YaaA [Dietzia sp. PP-33]
MRILLSPSETKSVGGSGGPLDLASLSLTELTETRRSVADALVTKCVDDPVGARSALGLSDTQSEEVTLDAQLWSSPTAPALSRYTGVLYDALDQTSLTRAARSRAESRLWIGSALFGLIAAADPIPHYRLSAGTRLPGTGTLRTTWKPALTAATAGWADDLVVDLRSGGYHQLGPVTGAVTVDVVTEYPDGTRKVVSHFSKFHKGLLARTLATSRAEMGDVAALLRVARRAGHTLERTSETALTMVTDP